MSIPIIVNVEAGEKECGKCHLRFGSYCRHFGDDHFEPLDLVDYYDDRYCRLPACLAAEQEYKRLKNGPGYHDVSEFYKDDEEPNHAK